MSKKQILIDNIGSIKEFKNKKFIELLKISFCTIKPSKKRSIAICFIIALLVYPIELCIKSNNTISSIKDIVGLSNGIIMAMFAILFTGYALFQALINRNSLKVLFLSKSKHKRILFAEYNLYFFAMCILYIILILLNYVTLFIIILIGNGSIINMDEIYKNNIVRIYAYIHIYLNIFAITEIKSFIYNLFQCFNISAMSTMIDALHNYDDDLHEKQ